MAITAGQQIEAADFVASSSGASDSGKVPKLNASGKIPVGFVIAFPGTQVFNSTGPDATWTDLDLSSVIGAFQRMVFLRITHNGGGELTISFRKNGETVTMALGGDASNPSQAKVGATPSLGYALAITDTSGIVEWTASGPGVTVTLNVEAYW